MGIGEQHARRDSPQRVQPQYSTLCGFERGTCEVRIYSTMFGGIPNSEIAGLGEYWEAFPTLPQDIFAPDADQPYSSVKTGNVPDVILANADVKTFKANFAAAFADFQTMLHQRLVDHVEEVKELEESDRISADIFRRIASLPLVDKYAAYQILADHWQNIMGDIEIIQSEGMGACNVVEPKYKMVKDKNGVEQEVPDGEKGRIMSFDLIQHTYFQTELDAIAALSDRIGAVNGEVDAIKEDFSEDEQENYLDAEKDNALDKNKQAQGGCGAGDQGKAEADGSPLGRTDKGKEAAHQGDARPPCQDQG